jgi:hypothetical protein
MTDKLNLNFNNSTIKQQDRSRGRMKITIKFSKEEAEAFKTFMTVVKPEELTEDLFFKQIFFMGCKSLDEQLKSMLDEHKSKLQAQKDEAMASGEAEQPQTPNEETK